MAVSVANETPIEATLAVTVAAITRGAGCNFVEIQSATSFYVVYDDALADGAAVPATARFLVPAGTIYVADLRSKRCLIAASSGTPTASFLGHARDPRRRGT